MIKPKRLYPNDTVALVSLSSNNIGDPDYSFRLELIEKRMKKLGLNYVFSKNALLPRSELDANPNLIAQDIVDCLLDDNIKAILAINGGKNAIDTIHYLEQVPNIDEIIRNNPKILLGFSDTTIQHFFFYNRGVQTYYGQNVVCDICEQEEDMFDYTLDNFNNLFLAKKVTINPSKYWFKERPSYDSSQNGVKRVRRSAVAMSFNFPRNISGEILGGCVERISSMLTDKRYISANVMPSIDKWCDKILFLESCDYNLDFAQFQEYLTNLDNFGIFSSVKGIVYGRNPNEQSLNSCYEALKGYATKYNIPLLYNVNIGHASPRAIIPLGAKVTITPNGVIKICEPFVR